MIQENLLTVKEMANILSVPVSWLYQRTRLGQEGIPHIKMGKYVRFKRDEVLDFLKSSEN